MQSGRLRSLLKRSSEVGRKLRRKQPETGKSKYQETAEKTAEADRRLSATANS